VPGHDIIVIGASAGGVEALPQVLSKLPKTLPAAIFIVLHVPAESPSQLPAIIRRAVKLTTSHAEHGQEIEHGHIYIAPPDFHLRLEDGRTQLVHGPKENRHRPAIDTLFRSAAKAYGPRVIGVILTGALDDGTQGLELIKNCGGITIVQNPEEAFVSSMPLSALRYVEVDHVLNLEEMGPLLVRLAKQSVEANAPRDCAEAQKEVSIMESDISLQEMEKRMGAPSGFICPDCNGPLWETKAGDLPHFRCLVGHAFSPESLLAGESDAVERALWTAVKTLEERAALLEKLAARAGKLNQNLSGASFRERSEEHRNQAALIRGILDRSRKAA
jgi:two-component system, chemotaxis family, protein-glutamate methylesterase/glutaminase